VIAEFQSDNELRRFRISFLSRKEGGTKYDVELEDLNEVPTDRYKGVRIDHYKFKDAIRTNKIKLII
jgi:hypothetical protein